MKIVKGEATLAERIVRREMAASSTAGRPGERRPAVFGAPSLLSEMERVAFALLQPLLGRTDVSVGVAVEIGHLAPTPVGALLRSHARVTAREWKPFWFDVWAEDPVRPSRQGTA